MDAEWAAACFRRGQPWSKEDDALLLAIFEAGPGRVKWFGVWRTHPMYVAAKKLGRSPGTCAERHWRLLRAPTLAARLRGKRPGKPHRLS